MWLIAGLCFVLMMSGIMLHCAFNTQYGKSHAMGAVLVYVGDGGYQVDPLNNDRSLDHEDRSWKYRNLQVYMCHGLWRFGFLYEVPRDGTHRLWVWIPHWVIVTSGAVGMVYSVLWAVRRRRRANASGFPVLTNQQRDEREFVRMVEQLDGD
jgi:hypothetical protein